MITTTANTKRNKTLWGLALSAAIQIVCHNEVAISIHGSTAARYDRDPVNLLREIIYDTMESGLEHAVLDSANNESLEGEQDSDC